jgi:hypothetical protein
MTVNAVYWHQIKFKLQPLDGARGKFANNHLLPTKLIVEADSTSSIWKIVNVQEIFFGV